MLSKQKISRGSELLVFLIALCLLDSRHEVVSAEIPAEILSTTLLYKQPGRYIGWPSITRTRQGELIVVFSGDRDAHVCPWGKTQMIRSQDQGRTWSAPVTITNTPLDDRDAGILETRTGALLVFCLTSLEFTKPEAYPWISQSLRTQWKPHVDKLSSEVRRKWRGRWVRRSIDGGKTWGQYIRTPVGAPHGAIQLADGRLLYVGTGKDEGRAVLGVAASEDDGLGWRLISTIPVPVAESVQHYCEPHLVEIDKQKLVALFRYQGEDAAQHFLYQSESRDGGLSWSVLHKTPIWGYPPHIVRLRNGWLLAVYGRRKAPFGQRACISRDGGKTWEVEYEITLASSFSSDLGYPASVQLEDGSILTVFYQVHKPSEKPSLMATHWRLNENFFAESFEETPGQ